MKKKIIAVLTLLMIFSSVSFTVTAQSIPDERQCSRLVDSADLLSELEEEALLLLLDSKSEENEFDIVINTVESTGDKTIEAYADDYFDYNGFGYGEDGDGLVLVIAMDIREYYISTCGSGIDLFTYDALDYCENAFVPYLSSGNYYTAFSEFITAVTDVTENRYNGGYYYDNSYTDGYYDDDYYYDYDNSYENQMSIPKMVGISLIVGFIIAIVIALVHAGKLKSVRSQSSAVNYVEDGSFVLSQSSDRFLYRNVTKRRRPKQNTSGGSSGSRVHVSSSGRSHGGGGGKF